MKIKPIYRIFATLVNSDLSPMTIDKVPEQIRDGVQYVLDTEYSNKDTN